MKKRGLVLIIGILGFGLMVGAQGRNANRFVEKKAPMTQQKAECSALDLNLTDAQRVKVEEFYKKREVLRDEKFANFKNVQQTNREDWLNSRKQFRDEMAKFRAEGDVELEKIIGKDNMTLLQQKRNETQKANRENSGRRMDVKNKNWKRNRVL
jgi:hypothetical protein